MGKRPILMISANDAATVSLPSKKRKFGKIRTANCERCTSRTILDEIRHIVKEDGKQTQRNYEDQKERDLEQTTELAAVLSASVSQRPRVLVTVSPEDVKDGILEADGLQRALAPVTAAGGSNTAAAVPAAAAAAPSAALDAGGGGGGGDETRPAACGLPGRLSGGAAPRERRLHGDAPAGVVRGAGGVAVGAGVGGTVRRPLAVYLRPSPAVLRPEEAGEVGRGAGGRGAGVAGGGGRGDGPLGPVAGQVLQGIGQGAGSPCERSTRIDLNCIPFLPKSTSI
jgi:hypothetical protein